MDNHELLIKLEKKLRSGPVHFQTWQERDLTADALRELLQLDHEFEVAPSFYHSIKSGQRPWVFSHADVTKFKLGDPVKIYCLENDGTTRSAAWFARQINFVETVDNLIIIGLKEF